MAALIIQLVTVLVPVIMPLIRELMDKNGGKLPTDEEVIAELHRNTAKSIAEADEWLARHPKH